MIDPLQEVPVDTVVPSEVAMEPATEGEAPVEVASRAAAGRLTDDMRAQIEQGLSSLPDDTKDILAAFSIAPEFAQILGELISPEVGEFFQEFTDPEMTLVAVPVAELLSAMAADANEGTPVDAQSVEQVNPTEETTKEATLQ